jgi:hypothetical protein
MSEICVLYLIWGQLSMIGTDMETTTLLPRAIR